MTRLVLPWPPTTGNDLYEGSGRHRHLLPCVRSYWRVLNLRWIQAGRPTFTGPVSIAWEVTQPRDNDVDWDNLRKIIMDGLSAPRGRNKHVRALMFPQDSMRLIRRETLEWRGISKTNSGIALEVCEIGAAQDCLPFTERPDHTRRGHVTHGRYPAAPAEFGRTPNLER